MRPERFLGSDPTPGDLAAIDRLAADLREAVLALSAGRRHLDALVGPGSLWHGREGRGLVEAVSDMSRRLRVVEDAVVDLARALESWRTGLVQRQERTASLTEWVSQLSGSPDADERRTALLAETSELAADHESDAASLTDAAEAMSLAMSVIHDEPDLAADLELSLTALTEAVERWVATAAQPLLSAVRSVEDAADLTAAVSVLIGFDGEVSPQARAVGRSSTGAHRVQLALQQAGVATALPDLPRASFERADVSLAQRLRGLADDDEAAP